MSCNGDKKGRAGESFVNICLFSRALCLTRVSHCLFTSLSHLSRDIFTFIFTSSHCYLGSTLCSVEGEGWDPECDKVSENSDVVGEAEEEDPAKAEDEEMEADMETRRGGRKSMSLRYSRNRPSIDTNSSPPSPVLGSCVLRLSPAECLDPTQRLFEGWLELMTSSCCEELEFNLSFLPPLLLLSIVVCVVACTVGIGREDGLW